MKMDKEKVLKAMRKAGVKYEWRDIFGNWRMEEQLLFCFDKEPRWSPFRTYRVKPKTEKYYFALCKWKGSNTVDAVSDTSREELQRKAAAHDFEIIGNIIEREVEL